MKFSRHHVLISLFTSLSQFTEMDRISIILYLIKHSFKHVTSLFNVFFFFIMLHHRHGIKCQIIFSPSHWITESFISFLYHLEMLADGYIYLAHHSLTLKTFGGRWIARYKFVRMAPATSLIYAL